MNREQKLNFIRENHQELYRLLKANVPDFVTDVWNASMDDIMMYNSWLGFYCGKIQNLELMEELRIN